MHMSPLSFKPLPSSSQPRMCVLEHATRGRTCATSRQTAAHVYMQLKASCSWFLQGRREARAEGGPTTGLPFLNAHVVVVVRHQREVDAYPDDARCKDDASEGPAWEAVRPHFDEDDEDDLQWGCWCLGPRHTWTSRYIAPCMPGRQRRCARAPWLSGPPIADWSRI